MRASQPIPPQPGPPHPFPAAPYCAPPPRRDDLLLVVVIAVVGLLALAGLASWLFFAIALPVATPAPPDVAFSSVTLTQSAAMVSVVAVSAERAFTFFRMALGVDANTSPALPLMSNESVQVGRDSYTLLWLDEDSSGSVTLADAFRVISESEFRANTNYSLALMWFDSRILEVARWNAAVTRPVLTFTSPNFAEGNVTVWVAIVSQAVAPSNYRVNMQVNSTTGTAVGLPVVSGSFASLTVGSRGFRVYWTDIGGEGTVNGGDGFRITGDGVPLPGASSLTLYLLWTDGALIQSASLSTP